MKQTITSQEIIHPLIIQENVPLHDKNWFKTGGPARFYAEPTDAASFQFALEFAREHNLEIFVLGEGANILISDDGFDGLVIRPQLKHIAHRDQDTDVLVAAGSGVTMDALIEYCLSNNILGLEEFSGIPGTVGGSVYINLHYFQFLLAQFMVSGTVIERSTGIIKTVDTEWFNFGYNQSTLHDEQHYLVDATFKLKPATDIETAYARGRRVEIIRHRTSRYPSKNTCGSFFRNFHENEVTIESNGKKMIFVAYYLDKIGVKGTLTHGDAIVSYQHANMLVNRGNATTQDIIEVARTMQELVHKEFGIIPQPECRLIGFKEYPLKLA
jgi:UDP-N-acetylmuramate dehydrogenase